MDRTPQEEILNVRYKFQKKIFNSWSYAKSGNKAVTRQSMMGTVKTVTDSSFDAKVIGTVVPVLADF